MIAEFALERDVVQLNHGSFGACPNAVLAAQSQIRARMEAEPTRFFTRELPELLDETRARVADFVGAQSDDLVFVRNATFAVNAVLSSLEFAPGDELVTTDHVYGACKNAMDHVAKRAGAKLVIAEVPFPTESPEVILEAVRSALTDRTRLVLLDHVTSASALVFPIAELTREIEARGIPVLIDGAHAPGMVPLDLEALGASYFTGNLHKWVCAPKGAAFLHVRRDRQQGLHPSVTSHGYSSRRERSRLLEEFDWCGTDDYSSVLAVPTALDTLPALLQGQWTDVYRHNHELCVSGVRLICDALDMAAPVPPALLGSMATIALNVKRDGVSSAWDVDPLQAELYEQHRIEVPVFAWPTPTSRVLRISAQVYNSLDDYRCLAAALAVSQLRSPGTRHRSRGTRPRTGPR